MKKNYTLKLVLAALVVVLVSLVSFVGVYKGKNLLKEYSLGKDFTQRKVVTFSAVEEQTDEEETEKEDSEDQNGTEENKEENSEDKSEENSENKSEENSEETAEKNEDESKESSEETTEQAEENKSDSEEQNKKAEPLTEEQKKANYKKTKNNIARRLTAMQSEEYDIRLDEETGKLVIEIPADMEVAYLREIAEKGKIQIKNTSSNEIIVDSNALKNASARLDTTTYSKNIVIINLKLSKEAQKKVLEANQKYTDSEGNESEASFAILIDDVQRYEDKASVFVDSAKKGEFNLIMGQDSEGEELQEAYQTALAITAKVKCGEMPVAYSIENIEYVSSDVNIKAIVIVAIIMATLMFIFAVLKFKSKAILPVLALVGLVATILLVLRYTNVKITLFSILGLAVITVINYIIILRTLKNKKSFKENLVDSINLLIPCILVAVVFCCSPYLQLASFGMTIFWGLIVMFIYNYLIVRILIEK